MPIYEYECTKCGEKFELRRNIADSDSDVKSPNYYRVERVKERQNPSF
jgi:putative FmdB family regulatory protein